MDVTTSGLQVRTRRCVMPDTPIVMTWMAPAPIWGRVVVRTRRRGQQIRTERAPLFPSYVFVAVDFETQRWRPILATFGVRTVVRTGDRPGTVPTPFIDALRGREIDGAIAVHHEQLRQGQKVRLETGALQGLIGTIIEMDERARIVVLMDLLNQQVRVKVDRAQVAALPAQ